MFEKILNFFHGYISVKAVGGFGEKFVNLCAKRNIEIRQMRYIGKEMFFITKPKYYRKIKKVGEESGMQIEIFARVGLPFWLKRNRERCLLLIGILSAICFVMLMSTRIWTVKIVGNENVFDGEIMSELESLGVRVGTRKRNIDPIVVQESMLTDFDGRIIWASLNIEGMTARMEIREVKKAGEYADEKPCNIVADFDGVIKTMKVYAGTAVEEVKSAVRKGDLLISGIVEYYDGASNFVQARGEVTAEHTLKAKVEGGNETCRRYTRQKKTYRPRIFAITLFPKSTQKNKNGEMTKFEISAELNNVVLPFSIIRYTESEYDTVTADENLRYKYLTAKYLRELEDTLKNSYVLSVNTKYNSSGDCASFTAEIRCVDFLGKSVPINIKNE